MDEIIQWYYSKVLALISGPQILFDGNLHGALPTESGIYRVFKKGSDWTESIYVVGNRTGTLQDRVYGNLLMGDSGAHTLKRKLIKVGICPDEESVKQYLKNNCLVQFLVIPEVRERSLIEHFTISVLKPEYND